MLNFKQFLEALEVGTPEYRNYAQNLTPNETVGEIEPILDIINRIRKKTKNTSSKNKKSIKSGVKTNV